MNKGMTEKKSRISHLCKQENKLPSIKSPKILFFNAERQEWYYIEGGLTSKVSFVS